MACAYISNRAYISIFFYQFLFPGKMLEFINVGDITRTYTYSIVDILIITDCRRIFGFSILHTIIYIKINRHVGGRGLELPVLAYIYMNRLQLGLGINHEYIYAYSLSKKNIILYYRYTYSTICKIQNCIVYLLTYPQYFVLMQKTTFI